MSGFALVVEVNPNDEAKDYLHDPSGCTGGLCVP